MELKRVVVTGLGALTPLGNNIKDYWENSIKGVSGSDIITRFILKNLKQNLHVKSGILTPMTFSNVKKPESLIYILNLL